MAKKIIMALFSAMLLAGCYVKKVEKTEPRETVIRERPSTDVVVHEHDDDSDTYHRKTTVTNY